MSCARIWRIAVRGGRKNKQKMKNEQHNIQNASNQSELR